MILLLVRAIPTFISWVSPFLPFMATIIEKIPTRHTDPIADRIRAIDALVNGKTAEEIAAIGKIMQATKDDVQH